MILDPKLVFFGTPEFAAIVLEKMIKGGFVPAAVVCNPDRPVGRKKVITPPPVKQRIMNYESGMKDKIQILQPEKLDEEFCNALLNTHADLFIIAAYAKILPKEILAIPRLGTIGVHPSLLPKYRGSSPIQSAILEGESETGVTLYLVDEKMDHGPILAQRELENDESGITHHELLMRAFAAGAELLIETLPKFMAGEITPIPQNEAEATYTKKFERKDGYIEIEDLRAAESGMNPEKAVAIERKIRAFNPEPGVWTISDGAQVKLLEAEIRDGKLIMNKTQKEGEKPKNKGLATS